MKKSLLSLLFLCFTFAMGAATPKIPLMQAFDGRYYDKPGVTISETRQPPANYYYSIKVESFKDNPESKKIVETLLEWANQTEKMAQSVNKTISAGKRKIILILPDGINVGVDYDISLSHMRVYLQSKTPL